MVVVGEEVAVEEVEVEVEITIEGHHDIHDLHHRDVGIRQIETAIGGYRQGGILTLIYQAVGAGVVGMIEEGAHVLLDALYLALDHVHLLRHDDVVTLPADPLCPYAEEQVMEEVEGLLIAVMIEQDP